MLLENEQSTLLLVDVQEKLMPLIFEWQNLLYSQKWLVELANDLSIPIGVSEQYPKGLGPTLPELLPLARRNSAYYHFDKCEFSCFGSEIFQNKLEQMQRKQIVLIGIEAHVCILQTAIHLRQAGYQVFVVSDAVGSRMPYDKELAILRMMAHGIQVITREMVFFEWLRSSNHEKFSELSKKYLRSS